MTPVLSRMFRLILSIHSLLVRMEKTVLCLLLFSMIGLAFFQVILRNFFDFGFVWINDVLRAQVIWLVFIGAALAAEQQRHLRIDIVSRILKNRAVIRRLTDAFADLFTTAASILLFWAAVHYIILTRPYSPQSVFFGTPEWVLRLVIPYAFAAMAVRSVAFVVNGLRRLKREIAVQ